MKIHRGYDNLNFRNPVVTMGTFDGVHLGHRLVIEHLKKRSAETGGESVIITFYPHPRQVLAGSNVPAGLLSTQDEKAALLEELGIDHLVVISFDHEFSNKEACAFVEEVLVGRIGARHLIVGFNHHFGKRGEGDFVTIRECAENLNLTVEMLEPMASDGNFISSSMIRDALISGNLEDANRLLGYSYFISGTVVEGRKLGRNIGFPTANILPGSNEKLLPRDGVYAVEVVLNEVIYKGVMSIGLNPTVETDLKGRKIEVHIFGFNGNIYGSAIKAILKFRIRDEMVFDSLESLSRQIGLDMKRAMELLG